MFDLFFPKHWSTLKKLIWLKAAALSSAVQKTVSGAILSIKDALAMPAIALSVDIDPVQNLNGYSYPWASGGGPNNLFDEANATIWNRWINNEDVWKATSDSTSVAIPCKANTTYILKPNNDSVTVFKVGYLTSATLPPSDATNRQAYGVVRHTDNSEITITTGANATYLVVQINYAILNARNSQLQIQEGSTLDPWANVCPITGWTGANIHLNDTIIPITFPDSAGTVYGGTLDVTTGVLTVDRAISDLGSASWSKSGSRFFTTGYASVIERPLDNGQVTRGLCDRYASIDYGSVYSGSKNGIAVVATPAGSAGQVSIRDLSLESMTAAEFKTYITGAQFVYPLATPQTYQLTPQEVTMLLGNNTIWADTGNTTLTYMADGRADDLQALNILLGGRYQNLGAPDEATDAEALNILLGR